MNKLYRSLVMSVLYLFILPLSFAQNDQNPTETQNTDTQNPSNQNTAQQQQQPNPGLQTAGQVVWVKGTVKATYPDQQPRVLARGAVVYEQDTIKTETDGSGQIAFTDNSMVALNPDTTLKIEQYYFDQQKPTEGGQAVMNLVKGGMRAVTGFVAKASPANYQTKTPVGTIGVRGTEYTSNCPKIPGQCTFGLLRGAIVVSNAAGSYELNAQTPYATVASYTTKAILSKTPPSTLGKQPAITPSNAPAQGGSGGGNCGILINS